MQLISRTMVLALFAVVSNGFAYGGIIHVDDDAPGDPLPGDLSVGDPLEDGSVEHPFDSISEALDAAEEGDTVSVADGSYSESLTMKSAVALTGSGPEDTVVYGDKSSAVLGFAAGVPYAPSTLISDISFAGGDSGIDIPREADTVSFSLENVACADNISSGVGIECFAGVTATMNGCAFLDNGGEGILADSVVRYMELTLTGCEIAGNDRAGIDMNTSAGAGTEIRLVDCDIHNNGAQGLRGYSRGENAFFRTTDCKIYDNASEGIHIEGYWNRDIFLVSQNCEWTGNGSHGISLSADTNDAIADAAVTDDLIIGNGGDGLHIDSPAGPRQVLRADVRRTHINRNDGWGIFTRVRGGFSRGYFTYQNILVDHNISGGLFFATAEEWSTVKARLDATVLFATVADNGLTGLKRNIWDTRVSVNNSIITSHIDDLVEMEAEDVAYCNTGNGTHAGVNGNISGPPVFANPEAGDYHLLPSSPCIDAGNPDFIPDEGETDIDGNPRLTGARVDIGAHETPPPDLLPKNVNVFPPAIQQDATFGVTWLVQNHSAGAAEAPWSDVAYLSADSVLDETDEPLCSREQPAGPPLGSGGGYNAACATEMPHVSPGSYYIIVNVDAEGQVDEMNETNNTASRQIEVLEPPSPELVIDGYSLVNRTQVTRTVFNYELRVTVRNNGDTQALDVSATLENWPDNILDVPDAEVTFEDIAAGESSDSSDTCTIRVDRRKLINEALVLWRVSSNENETLQDMVLFLKPGDVNMDGSINVFDLLVIRNSLGMIAESGKAAWADVNNDGIVNVADLLVVKDELK